MLQPRDVASTDAVAEAAARKPLDPAAAPFLAGEGEMARRMRALDWSKILWVFVDERAVFVAKKTHEGRALVALERPGLWNGAMARWETVFVEVPRETFAPVKTILDLLRPEHLPPGADP